MGLTPPLQLSLLWGSALSEGRGAPMGSWGGQR